MKAFSVFSVIFLSLFLLFSDSIQAQQSLQKSEDSIEVSPTFQEVTIVEGAASASAKMSLTNNTNEMQTFEVLPIVIQQFDQQGNVTLADKPLSAENVPLANFVSHFPPIATVAAQRSLDIPFTITNSRDLSPGGHYVAIVARLRSSSENKQMVLPAVSSFLLIRKEGGEEFHLSLAKTSIIDRIIFRLPSATSLQFSNFGNVHVIPRGKIEITDMFHRLIVKGIINENSFYIFPNTQRTILQSLYPVSVPLPISLFKVTITGNSQPGDVVFQQLGWLLYVDPIGLIGGLAVTIVVITILVYLNRKKKNKYA